MRQWLVLATMLGATSSCALLAKSTPVVPRYFSPEPTEASSTPSVTQRPQLAVRLGRIGSGSYLKERMVHRDSEYELGFYEDRRWAERPEAYLQRALESSLFEQRGFTRAVSPRAPTLTADLVEFDEITGTAPRVRLRVSYALHDELTVFLERTYSIERPVEPGSETLRPARVAAALGVALREAVGKIADDVARDIASRVGSSS
jgi:uncharacterized lipoprotein YmbA